MKIIDEETVELDNHDYLVIKAIKRYCRQFNLVTDELDACDFENIANSADAKKGLVKVLVENLEID